MFQTILSGISVAVLTLLEWIWNRPEVASLTVSTMALVLLIWLHIPKRLEYYWQHDRRTIRPFNVRNEIPQHVSGRIPVLFFCLRNGMNLSLRREIARSFLEFFLKVVGIPNPCAFSWDGGLAAIQVYPLGHSRFEYVRLCIARKMWPWKRSKTLKQLLDRNRGYLPGLEHVTFLVSLRNRLYS